MHLLLRFARFCRGSPMPSEFERTIQHYRGLVLQKDTAALTRLELAYQESLDRLRPSIELLQQQVNGLDDPLPGDVFRLERYKTLTAQMEDELRRLGRLAEAQTTANQRELVNLAGQSARAMVMAQAPSVAMQWVNVPTEAIQSLVGTLSDGSPLARLFDDIAPDALLKARGALVDGMVMGKNPRVVAQSLAKGMEVGRARALTIARTEMLRSYRSSTLERYRQNEDLLDGWEWISAHQSRTCGCCIALDGKLFQMSERFQKSHVCCRCSSIPKLKGVTIDREKGDEWLARQPQTVQDGILGKDGGKSYRNGDVALDDFVKLDSHPVWGESYRKGSLAQAKANAKARGGTIVKPPRPIRLQLDDDDDQLVSVRIGA